MANFIYIIDTENQIKDIVNTVLKVCKSFIMNKLI